MQDSHHQLTHHSFLHARWSTVAIAVLTPLLLVAAIPILPTFDDWTSLIAPSFEPFFSKERFLFYGYHWRPFDSTFGYIVGLQPQLLFPLLNHVCVVMGHACGALLIYLLARKLALGAFSSNLAALFFFLSPGMLATVLAVDGLNQTYANLWALVSTLLYMSLSGWRKYASWLLFLSIATLCKENALMYALIAPALAYAFNKTSFSTFRKDIIVGIALMSAYAMAILLLPSNITIHPEYVPGISKSIKDVFKFLLTTWLAVDFVSLLHAPSRNLLIAGVTLLLSLPLVGFVFVRNMKLFLQKRLLILVACHFIAVAPHIFTVFSMMHTYAGLPFAALIIAVVIDQSKPSTLLTSILTCFFLAALFVDVHIWYKSYQSGLVGKEMAQQAIVKTNGTPQNVYIVIIADDYPRLSSFCVVPSDAFGWGRAVLHETNYQWPIQLNDTTIERNSQSRSKALEIARHTIAEHKADCVWIVDGKEINVVK